MDSRLGNTGYWWTVPTPPLPTVCVCTPRYNGVRCVHNAFRHGASPPSPHDMINRALCYLLRTTTVRKTEENEGWRGVIPKGWNRNLLAPLYYYNYLQLFRSLLFLYSVLFFLLHMLDWKKKNKGIFEWNETKICSCLLFLMFVSFWLFVWLSILGIRRKKRGIKIRIFLPLFIYSLLYYVV